MKKKLSFRTLFRPQDPQINPYRMLPFEVPPGIRTVEVQYLYDKSEENVIDLGLFDPRGSAFLQGWGFRGWSGSARNHVIVSESWATPGYLPGDMPPGTWHVLLGLYKIGNRCPCEVDIILSDDPVVEAQSFPSFPSPPSPSVASGWVKGDLHCHTYHSDAESTGEEMWATAGRKGLDFLAITDHNTISHLAVVKKLCQDGALIIPGQEITTYQGHANVFGVWDWVDFRCTKDEEIAEISAFVHARNGVFSINHPKTNGPQWGFFFDFDFDCLEVWQAFWQLRNSESLGLWDVLLQRGRRVIAVGGSDAHPRRGGAGNILEWLGYPTTWIFVEETTVEGLIQALKCGRITISACPHGPFLEIEFSNAGENVKQGGITDRGEGKLRVRVCGGEGFDFRLVSAQGIAAQARVPRHPWEWVRELNLAEHGYIRAELSANLPNGTREVTALTNPIWYKPWLERQGGTA